MCTCTLHIYMRCIFALYSECLATLTPNSNFLSPLSRSSLPLPLCVCVCVCVCVQVQGKEVKELSALALSGMSARERNRAKRKARQLARRNSRESDTPERV